MWLIRREGIEKGEECEGRLTAEEKNAKLSQVTLFRRMTAGEGNDNLSHMDL